VAIGSSLTLLWKAPQLSPANIAATKE